jgi:hypothetical protein
MLRVLRIQNRNLICAQRTAQLQGHLALAPGLLLWSWFPLNSSRLKAKRAPPCAAIPRLALHFYFIPKNLASSPERSLPLSESSYVLINKAKH